MVQRNLPLDSQGHGFARRSFLARAGAVGALAAAGQAGAQFRVEVTDLGASQLPIAFPAFRGELTSPHSISPIVRADLERSGMFRSIDANPFILDEATRPDFAVWRKRGADFLVAGRVTRLVNDRFDIRVQLWDCVRGQELGYVRYEEKPGDMRLAAHVIADFIYEKLIGEKSVFATRIAYVTKTSSAHTLWVADSDGQNAVAAFSSKEPIISRLGLRGVRIWPTCLFTRAGRSFMPMSWPRVASQWWPISRAPTVLRPGRKTASRSLQRSAATAARKFTP